MSPLSSAPQTPSEVNPPPQLSAQTSVAPPIPQNKYIFALYKAGVPFIPYKDLIITDKLGQVREVGLNQIYWGRDRRGEREFICN